METIYKILENCEVKKVGERQYEFIASTADMDRDGEIIDVNGWDLKNFKKNPVIMYAHDYSTLPIGKATKIGVRDGKLMNVVEFPPEGTYEFADTVQRLVDTGYLKTQSVGFIPKKWEDTELNDDEEKNPNKPRRTYTKQELLEISIVPVPSNPNALRNAVEEGIITQKQLDSITETVDLDEVLKHTEKANLKPYPNEHACRLQPPDKFSEFRRGTREHEGKKYSVIFGKPKEGEGWKEQAYRYDKDTWEASEAKSHCESHDGSFEAAKPEKTSQEQIIDDIEYLGIEIEGSGLNDKAKSSLQRLAGKYLVNPYLTEDYLKEIEKIKVDVVQETTLPVKDISDDDIKLIISQTIKNVIDRS
jgi:HK97 family phage prohead protease